MKQLFSLFVIVSIIVLSACNNKKESTTTANKEKLESKENMETDTAEHVFQYGMFVASKKLPRQGMPEQKCLMVRAGWETVWTPLLGEIEGFDYKPGYEYHLEVKRTSLKNLPADGSAFRYELVRIINKEKKESDLRPEHEKPTFESTWNLKTLNGKDVSNYKAFVFFENNRMSAYSGCNTSTGIPFQQGKDNTLSFDDNSSSPTTLMGCPQGHIEDEYFKTLLTCKKYDATSRTLKLYNKEGEMILVFER